MFWIKYIYFIWKNKYFVLSVLHNRYFEFVYYSFNFIFKKTVHILFEKWFFVQIRKAFAITDVSLLKKNTKLNKSVLFYIILCKKKKKNSLNI